ncbi:hypothetical protein LCGC14_0577710 [marine sediment metagenome]|uniref:Uncharacterized protein n=1 Tax=marine sediment metagenome TaxID=412755 RepID=A0A0F9RHD1_9ZZZZ
MAGRVRLFSECRCERKEIPVRSMADANGYVNVGSVQCSRCWDVINFVAIEEPDWPVLLRGL